MAMAMEAMRWAYFYRMAVGAERVPEVAPRHAAYWRGLGLRRYAGGPFGDRSGGLITFEAGSREEAERLVAGDPFVVEGVLAQRWVEHWAVE